MVTLVATPGAFSTFAGWSGACSGTGTCVVTMSQARNVTATFNIQMFTITLTVQVVTGDSGTGSIQGTPAGCNGTVFVDKFASPPGPGPNTQTFQCQAGTTITVRGSRTSSWFGAHITGACSASIPGNTQGTVTCSFTVTKNETAFVTFQ
jgi:hypothetical protein